MNDLEQYFKNNKNELRFKTFETKRGNITITGIGNKALKYKTDDGEDEFAYFTDFDGRISTQFYFIATAIITSFDNELYNSQIRERIENQRKVDGPFFAPEHGFCYRCGNQIFLKEDGKELITGCNSCHVSYCD